MPARRVDALQPEAGLSLTRLRRTSLNYLPLLPFQWILSRVRPPQFR